VEFGLKDRVVLVTGATGGIGAAIVRAFAAEGARVAVAYRDSEEAAGRIADELGPGRGLAVRYPLDEPDGATAATAAVEQGLGPVDVLVANAVRWHVRRPREQHFDELAAEQWQPVVVDNLVGTMRCVQAAVGGMRRRGWGRIALISSHVATHGGAGLEAYGAAKAALHGFARSLAWDAGPQGVLVNVVSPGLTSTDRVLTGLPVALREQERQRTPTGRLSSPEDIANVVAFLCSAANTNLTGEAVTVAGGR
jgi:3-oxoacyl-[acyl-carrier protein] reductase